MGANSSKSDDFVSIGRASDLGGLDKFDVVVVVVVVTTAVDITAGAFDIDNNVGVAVVDSKSIIVR